MCEFTKLIPKPYLNDFSDGPLRNLDSACKFFVEFLLMPRGQLRKKGGRRVILVVLFGLVARFGVETLQQYSNIFV